MAIHNWTAVNPAYFHDFHFGWISEIGRVLNHGTLPVGFYALSQHQFKVDVKEESDDVAPLIEFDDVSQWTSGFSAAEFPPKTAYHFHGYPEYLTNSIAIMREKSDKLVAMIEIISPHNKDTSKHLQKLVDKIHTSL